MLGYADKFSWPVRDSKDVAVAVNQSYETNLGTYFWQDQAFTVVRMV